MNQTKFRATFTDTCCKAGAGYFIRELMDDIHELSKESTCHVEKEAYLKVAYLLQLKSTEIKNR